MLRGDDLEIGDRVDHKLFEMGVVLDVSESGNCFIPPLNRTGPVSRVMVQWDDPERADGYVMDWALTKVSSPDQRPFAYWEKKWLPLREEWLEARREVERVIASFSPAPAEDELAAAQDRERRAYEALETFWQDAIARETP